MWGNGLCIITQGLEVTAEGTCRCNPSTGGTGCRYCETPGSCGRSPATPNVCATLAPTSVNFGVANVTCQPDALDLVSCAPG